MDETLVFFDLLSNTTIDELGARSNKLPSLIIFKLKNVPRGNFPPEVIIRVNQKGWMNENEMLYWIENIWTKRERISNPQSLLVLDSFSAHIVDSVKRHFGEKNTNIAVIPGGLTSRLQPLNVSVNKSFKTKWMAEAVKELTPAGNLKKSSYETIANWVRDSWNAVDVDLIRKSFKCCGISKLSMMELKMTGFLTITVLDKEISRGDEVEIPSDDERGNEEDKKGKTDDEYVSEKGEIDEETDEEYVDEKEETDEEYVNEEGEEDEKGEYEGEKDGYDDEYYDHYDQGTNYVNV
ncbi:hypothetical protein RclHR1_25100001 [Rhizophagus clarus]|uniref:DDE-1 domain-containing protein n=1 Tax=Rhizophagus clarus TaxID=94130 RepID=A0A2Z6RCM2_9GLOM|nr:hypothetical protein RclHR1_25100001 [Rhizophagus clarus]